MSDEGKNPAAVALGKLGGAAGTGKAKRRSPEHYARISRLGGSAPKKNKPRPRNPKQNNRHAFGLGNGKIGKKMKRKERQDAREVSAAVGHRTPAQPTKSVQ